MYKCIHTHCKAGYSRTVAVNSIEAKAIIRTHTHIYIVCVYVLCMCFNNSFGSNRIYCNSPRISCLAKVTTFHTSRLFLIVHCSPFHHKVVACFSLIITNICSPLLQPSFADALDPAISRTVAVGIKHQLLLNSLPSYAFQTNATGPFLPSDSQNCGQRAFSLHVLLTDHS